MSGGGGLQQSTHIRKGLSRAPHLLFTRPPAGGALWLARPLPAHTGSEPCRGNLCDTHRKVPRP